jgi:hypothetical protein
MNAFGFLLLNKEQQTDIVLKSAYLDVRVEEDNVILLFDLGGFYAEMHYAYSPNKITKFTAFKSTAPLAPYLKDINIADNGITLANFPGANWR